MVGDWSGAQYYPNHSVTTQPYHPQVSLGVMTIRDTYYGPKTTQLKGELGTIKELHDTYITPWDHGPLGGTGQVSPPPQSSISLLLALGQQAL